MLHSPKRLGPLLNIIITKVHTLLEEQQVSASKVLLRVRTSRLALLRILMLVRPFPSLLILVMKICWLSCSTWYLRPDHQKFFMGENIILSVPNAPWHKQILLANFSHNFNCTVCYRLAIYIWNKGKGIYTFRSLPTKTMIMKLQLLHCVLR